MSLYDVLNKKTVLELRSYCEDNNINLEGKVKKADIISILEKFADESGLAKKIQDKQKAEEEKLVAKNVINLTYIKQDQKPNIEIKKPKTKKNEVALYSLRNLFWSGLGALETGYNIVSKEESEKWLTHKAVRIATPEEVARHYGKI